MNGVWRCLIYLMIHLYLSEVGTFKYWYEHYKYFDIEMSEASNANFQRIEKNDLRMEV